MVPSSILMAEPNEMTEGDTQETFIQDPFEEMDEETESVLFVSDLMRDFFFFGFRLLSVLQSNERLCEKLTLGFCHVVFETL